MEAKRQLVGSKHGETLEQLANIIGLMNFELEGEEGNVGKCFATENAINGAKMGAIISVPSKDSKGNPITEKYRINTEEYMKLLKIYGLQHNLYQRYFVS